MILLGCLGWQASHVLLDFWTLCLFLISGIHHLSFVNQTSRPRPPLFYQEVECVFTHTVALNDSVLFLLHVGAALRFSSLAWPDRYIFRLSHRLPLPFLIFPSCVLALSAFSPHLSLLACCPQCINNDVFSFLFPSVSVSIFLSIQSRIVVVMCSSIFPVLLVHTPSPLVFSLAWDRFHRSLLDFVFGRLALPSAPSSSPPLT